MPRKIAIGRFFEKIGFPLKAVRWSWGSQRGNTILLRVWDDDFSSDRRSVVVLKGWRRSNGLPERIGHLAALARGEIAGYALVAFARDPHASDRRIAGYQDETVIAIERLIRCSDGSIRAVLGEDVAIERVRRHSQAFRTQSSWEFERDAEMRARIERFARVKIRPEQRKFRERVFLACRGKCVVSQCSVPEALEAAHIKGRSWKDGHNSHADGILLRRDLHALYDAGLLRFGPNRCVKLSAKIADQYAAFNGVLVDESSYCFVSLPRMA